MDTQPQLDFDIFLAHNSSDKPHVKIIAQELKQRGLKPWLDLEQIYPGDTILEKVQDGIKKSKTGAFFIGKNGLGNFQENIELYTVINQFLFHKKKFQNFRVIPILLPGVNQIPEKVDFLAIWCWIKFEKLNDEAALKLLIASINGRIIEEVTDIPNYDLNRVSRDKIELLIKLLQRSPFVIYEERRGLCLDIGINPGHLPFIRASDDTFTIEIINYLHKTSRQKVICKLCEKLQSVFPEGEDAETLEFVKLQSNCM